MALRELLASFNIEVKGKEQLESTHVAIRKLSRDASKFGQTLKNSMQFLVIGGALRALRDFTSGQVEAADALKHNAEKLGLSTQELQRYQYAASQMQVTTQETAVALRFFNRAVGEAALGTKSAQKTFAELGLNIRGADGSIKPTSELLGEFSDKLAATKDQSVRTAYAMRLLGRGGSALLPALQQGSEGLKAVFKDLDDLGGGFSDDFINKSHEVDIQTRRLNLAWKSIYSTLAGEVLPYLKAFIDHGIKTAKVIIDLAKHTWGFRTALASLGVGAALFGVFKMIVLFQRLAVAIGLSSLPLLLIAALVFVAYLAVDDFYTLLNGGQSILGEWLDQIGGKGASTAFIKDVKEDFLLIKDAIFGADSNGQSFIKTIVEGLAASIPFVVEWGAKFVIAIVAGIDNAVTRLSQFIDLLGIAARVSKLAVGQFSRKDMSAISADVASIMGKQGKYEERMAKYGQAAEDFSAIGDPEKMKRKREEREQIDGARRANDMYGMLKGGPHLAAPAPAGGAPVITLNIHQAFHGPADATHVKKATKDGSQAALRDAFSQVSRTRPATGQ